MAIKSTTVSEEAVKTANEAFHEAWNNNAGLDNELPSFAMRAALTAALPHLPGVRSAARKELMKQIREGTAHGFLNDGSQPEGNPDLDCPYCCGSGHKGDIHSSAARELALEEDFATIRAMIYCYEGDSAQAFEAQKALAKIENAIRALSSPDHADAGKLVEVRRQAIEDVLGALTAHELYQYRPKAFQGFIEYARNELLPHADAGKVEGDGWQPIESAPQDTDEPYLCYSPGNKRAHNEYARYAHYHIDGFSERWPNGRNQYPEAPYTHWRPLPSAPSQEVVI